MWRQKVVSRNLAGSNEEIRRNSQSAFPVFKQRFDPWTLLIRNSRQAQVREPSEND